MATAEKVTTPESGHNSAPAETGLPAHPPAPLVEVRYENLKYSIKLTAQQRRTDIPTVAGSVANFFLGPPKALIGLATGARRNRVQAEDFRILDDVSGVIRPGTMTL